MFDFNSQMSSIPFYLLVLWVLGLSFFLYKSISHYNRLVGKEGKDGLREVLERLLRELKVSKKEIETLKKKVRELEEKSVFHIQKIGLLKFNPFKDIGGEQSFILSFLDGKDSGVVITSLHGRETTRWYLKRVEKGKGVDYELSKEEIEVIKKAGKI